MFYVFVYDDGINTTYAGTGTIAGHIREFDSVAERDAWLEGPRVYKNRVPNNVGIFALAKTREQIIAMGHGSALRREK